MPTDDDLLSAPVGIECDHATPNAIEAAAQAADKTLARLGVTPFQGRHAQFTFEYLDDAGLLHPTDDKGNEIEVDFDALYREYELNEVHLRAWHEAHDAAANVFDESGPGCAFDMALDVDRKRPAAWKKLANAQH